ncbi:hypothetical protein F7Q92_06030 [Ideonella dechloratans]|uniref:YCII-related domain-containing protein n=1 Tax=Ideonella dechloratans TaxID=36863 RepID=A0A643FE06_IDEDE|nr:YciI family protein [Ideonella dechloratans]KAB0583821.1 hypothetical protein F7Q92_06030 [Ideonella dechloratans]UFU12031.1 YciI family protein [Ideonella dechloratans]
MLCRSPALRAFPPARRPLPLLGALFAGLVLQAAPLRPARAAEAPAYDAALAQRLGADARGMRSYVLVLLRSSGHPVPAGPARDAMFQGHFANIGRLAQAGTLALAGPADGVEGLRGLFVLAVPDIEAARALVGTDPVIREGEMVAEYHRFYGTAGLMALYEIHQKLQAPQPAPP